jgi:diaminopimelate decarboxylase
MADPTPQPDPATDPTPRDLVARYPHLTREPTRGLCVDDVALARLAEVVGTPTFVYSAAALRRRYRALTAALTEAGLAPRVHYAVKANDHLAILSLLAREGAGADIVSEGELRRARIANIPAEHIVFSGVGKSARELRLALAEEIGQINVESAEELAMLSALASSLGKQARVALRVNPDVDARTHEKISTGRARDKFGIAYTDAARLYAHGATLPGIRMVGLATHIGSQLVDLAPYHEAYARIASLVTDLRAAGQTVEAVDCGGGWGISYRDEPSPSPTAIAATLKSAFHNLDVRLAMEPGRWLVGPIGVLLASVILVKHNGGTRFVVLDAAMNDLVRPSMYQAWHGIVPVSAVDAVAPLSPADVVGPICESGDTFAKDRRLPPLAANALVAILDAGAYGRVMSSSYNARPAAAEVLVERTQWSVIRDRPPHSALWADERVPVFVDD